MARITVKHRHGQSFDIQVRGYRLVSDEPVTLGGEDEGPTPTELMVAGLAACAADEVVTTLVDMGLALEPIEVGADFAWDAEGRRIASVRLHVMLPNEIEDSARKRVEQAILSCPARKMLLEPPDIETELSAGTVSALAGRTMDGAGWPKEPPPDVDSEP